MRDTAKLNGCTGVAVIHDKQVLIGLRKDGQGWCIAGGKQEIDETIESCAYRELKEEFGLTGKDLQLIGRAKSEVREKGKIIFVEPTIYLCREYCGEIAIRESEIVAYQWMNIDQVLQLENLFPPTREGLRLIKDYLSK